MDSSRLRLAVVIVLTLCTVASLGACAPISITIGAPITPTLTASVPTTSTSTVIPSATVSQATDTPTTAPTATATTSAVSTATNPAPTSQPPPPPSPQPPPQQQPTTAASPSKPTDFKATGTGTNIEFTWTDKSINELGFRIYQVGQAAPVVSQPQHTATGGMSYTWTGRPCNLSGSFYIRAFNDAGESASSDSANAVTIPCQQGSLIAQGGDGSIHFNWNDLATNESGFRMYQEGVNAPVGSRGADAGSGGINLDLTNLPCNVDAKYFVRAYNSAGESPDSNHTEGITAPCAPTGLKQSGSDKTQVVFIFIDQSTNETGFHIYRDDVLVTTKPANSGSGLQTSWFYAQGCGQNHVYSIKAYNSAGESRTSEHVGLFTSPC